ACQGLGLFPAGVVCALANPEAVSIGILDAEFCHAVKRGCRFRHFEAATAGPPVELRYVFRIQIEDGGPGERRFLMDGSIEHYCAGARYEAGPAPVNVALLDNKAELFVERNRGAQVADRLHGHHTKSIHPKPPAAACKQATLYCKLGG